MLSQIFKNWITSKLPIVFFKVSPDSRIMGITGVFNTSLDKLLQLEIASWSSFEMSKLPQEVHAERSNENLSVLITTSWDKWLLVLR